MNEKLTIAEGTISFWINSSIFTVHNDVVLGALNPEGGSILIYIEKNVFKIAFIILGRGRTDLSVPFKDFETKPKHMITFTWNLNKSKLVLYIDGTEKCSKIIN